MSLASTQSKQIYAFDGVKTVFPIPFPLLDMVGATDLLVYAVDALGNVTLLTIGYTVNLGAMTVTYAPGGNPAPIGGQLILLRLESLTQILSLTDSGPFSAKAVEATFDRVFAILQQLQEQINRATLAPLNTPALAGPILAPTTGVIPTIQGTYAQLKASAALNPAQMVYGFATDLGAAGQMMFYMGNNAVGDGGWVGPLWGA